AAWVAGKNVRFWKGRWQTVGGWERIFAEALTGVCRTVLPWTDNLGALMGAFGTHSALQVYRGGELFDITPVGLAAGAEHGTGTTGYSTGAYGVGGYSEPSASDYFARTWALDTYGESLMANPRGETIYWWQNDTGTPAEPLTGAPDEVTYMLVTESRQVMAIGCNEEVSGTFNPLCIRFSDIENPEDWTTTPSNNAGEVILKGGGRLVAGRRFGEYVLAWTDSGFYVGTFIGDPSQTWRFDPVPGKCGLMGPNAVVIFGGAAYWVAPDGQFYVWAPGSAPAILPCTVRKDFTDNLAASQFDKVVASSCATFSEVRFDYPDARDGDGLENSRYIAVCTLDGAWTKGEMARSAYVDAGPSVSPIGVAPSGEVYWHERGATADGEPLAWYVESGDQYVDDDRRVMRVNDVEPDFEGQLGPVRMTISTRDFPQEPRVAWDPVTLAPGETFQDLRAEGRFMSVRFEGSSVPSFARCGRPSFDVITTGAR
ncbi:MAG: hypothetical protein JNK30_07175, partial [Phenylobacterium sp.]|uniref:hypothetical protein n=1 Tax=Phenylobacterium sp. TaxID=1871053 RepID=UPI001A37D19B